ncbi:MAG: hypothetical protein V4568_14725 [Pseudomonadota bacterium]
MEKDVELGSVGKLALSFSGGKALLSVTAGYSPAGASVSAQVSEDASVLIDLLFSAIEKASPAGAVPIEETVKALVKASVAAVA